MALSDWATLAIDMHGKPCRGILNGFRGGTLEIYKNRICVNDSRMWYEELGYPEPTIASIAEGRLSVAEFKISAVRREPQNSVFVYACTTRWDSVLKTIESRWMVGIGCAWTNEHRSGVTGGILVNFQSWLGSVLPENLGPMVARRWMKNVVWEDIVSFNQGDAFFADHLGTPVPASLPE